MKDKIFFRVDSSHEIGMGHLMRCLSLADYFREKNIESTFITLMKGTYNIITSKSYKVLLIEDFENYPRFKLKSFFSFHGINKILLDINYSVDSVFQKKYKSMLSRLKEQNFKVILFEKLDRYVFPANIVIIPYVGADRIVEKQNKTKYLLGPKYFPFRKEFYIRRRKKYQKKIKNILITMGGSDPKLITLKVCELISKLNFTINLKVVLGSLSKLNMSELKRYFLNTNINLELFNNTSAMSKLMNESDLGITNSGLTKYEMAKCKLPCLIISNFKSDLKITKEFCKQGSAIDIGCVDMLNKSNFNDVIKDLINNKIDRLKLISAGEVLTSGNGIKKIYDNIFRDE